MKTDKKIHYNVGQVDVEVNLSHMNKLRVLHMTMSNWGKNNGFELESKWTSLDAPTRRMYESDLMDVEELVAEGREILTKEEMLDMNVLFKTYGGIRKSPITSDELSEDGRNSQFKFEESLWDNVTFVTPDNS
jgi:hypothetical protein